MQKLNLPDYTFKTKIENNKQFIFDYIRKKFVSLTPEEWVRQNFISFLEKDRNYPTSLMAVEKSLKVNELSKRADILIYKNSSPILLVECKAPEVKITQSTFDQIARYNLTFKVPYLVVTNGMFHYCCTVDFNNNSFEFIKEIPNYKELL